VPSSRGAPRVSFITALCSLSSSSCIPLPTLATFYPIRCLRSPPLLSTEITMYYLVHYVEMTSATAREWPRMLNMLTERPLFLVCPQIVVRACCWSRQHRDQREPGGSRSVWQRGPALCGNGVPRCAACPAVCGAVARTSRALSLTSSSCGRVGAGLPGAVWDRVAENNRRIHRQILPLQDDSLV
jgi:hypothetical protein